LWQHLLRQAGIKPRAGGNNVVATTYSFRASLRRHSLVESLRAGYHRNKLNLFKARRHRARQQPWLQTRQENVTQDFVIDARMTVKGMRAPD
jgi:hypothetical protein